MSRIRRRAGRVKAGRGSKPLVAIVVCGGLLASETAPAQSRDSLAGERAAQALARSIEAESEQYNLRYGPVRFKTGASLGVSYTDNVFYSHDRQGDFVINPEISLAALWPVTERNALRLSLELGYEWYLKNSVLNANAPLVNPGSELTFHIFAGDFRIRLHERFSYQESLFLNSFSDESERFYNFNDVGKFSRLDNQAGFRVDWDLNKLVLSAEYNHENFISLTEAFEYLNRASEWLTASASFSIGDRAFAGLEGQASLHDYEQATRLSDNWRARVGPFVEVNSQAQIGFRAGAGFDAGRYDGPASRNSDYDSYYAYARIRQRTRLFTHALTVGREHLLGGNANNLETTYARYSISSAVVRHVTMEANLSVNLAEEFGGRFEEDFTYYGAGFRIGWQFHKFWRADLSYEFRLKESDLPLRDFDRNRLTLLVGYSF